MQSKHFFFLLVCLSCRSVEWTKSSWAEPKTRLTRRWSATPAARSVNRLPRLFMTRQTRKHVKISHFKLKFNQTHFGCHQVPPSPPQRPISMKKQTQRFTNEKERQRHRFRCCTQRQSDLICITFVSAVAECSARWATRRPAATQKWWRQLRCKSFLLNYFNLQLFKFLKNLAPHRHFFIFFWKFKFGAKSINRVLIKIDKGFFFCFFWKNDSFIGLSRLWFHFCARVFVCLVPTGNFHFAGRFVSADAMQICCPATSARHLQFFVKSVPVKYAPPKRHPINVKSTQKRFRSAPLSNFENSQRLK